MYDLRDKVALVTGAGGERGIGRAIARRLAQEGADLVVNDLDVTYESASEWRGLDHVVADIEALGRRALAVNADVSDASQVDELVTGAVDHFGHIDILVSNAAAPAGRDRGAVVELDENVWDLVQKVNTKGTFLCCRAVARQMLARGEGGKIIIISSTRGTRGAANFAAYCASKFAVIGFGQSLALELAPHRIQCNIICPGMIDTERLTGVASSMVSEREDEAEPLERMLSERSASIPLGRIGEGADVARVAAFLASSESDYLSGLSIGVTGGQLL